MVNLNGITSKPEPNGKVTLTHTCPWCKKEHSITVKQDEYLNGLKAVANGALIQNAFPTWTPDEREFLISGVCPKCWSKMFSSGNISWQLKRKELSHG